MTRVITIVASLVLLQTACSMTTMVANNMTGTMDNMKTGFYAESSTKHAFSAGPSMLMMLDGFIISSPENVELLQRGAEMNCAYAQTFLDDFDRDYARVLYEKGRSYALRGIQVENEDLYNAIVASDEPRIRELAAEADKDLVPLLFWTAICWGGQINAAMEADLAADLPVVEALVEKSVKENPGYFFGAGYVFYGVLNAGRSSMLGGDLEKGKTYFEKAFEISGGDFLMWKVMYAKTYALNKQDPDLFVSILEEVLAAPAGDKPDRRLANQVARERAAQLIEKAPDLFPGYSRAGSGPLEVEPVDPSEMNFDD